MKKFLPILGFFFLLGGRLTAQQLNIDFVIPRAARAVEEALPQRARVAVLNFTSPAEALSDYVIEELTGEFVKGSKVTVVDRRNLALISQEMNLQMSGDVGDDSAQAIGRMLGAQSIVSGSLTSMGTFYRLRVRVINVETAAIQTQFSHDVRNDARLAFLLSSQSSAAAVPAARVPAPQSPTPAVPQTQPVPAVQTAQTSYRIGDTGPAGGMIFYDKGDNRDGWRYLEAASHDAGIATWQANSSGIDGTKADIGAGKQNTQTIVNFMMENGVNTQAAMLCRQYSQGGYSDWFLPSKSELNLMYWNLKQKELGGFGNRLYWSSSQGSYSWGASAQNFGDGTQRDGSSKSEQYSVRPIRAF